MFQSLGVAIRRVSYETWLLLTILAGLLLVALVVVAAWLFLLLQVIGNERPLAAKAQNSAPEVVVRSNARELYGVSWHTDLDQAMAAAQEAPAKPVFVLRVLGDFAGFM